MKRLEKQLEEEIDKLLDLAHKDEEEQNINLDIQDEIRRRKDRYKKEKQEYDAKMNKRQKKEGQTGKKPRGRVPKAPDPKLSNTDQYNFTDPESRIMKTFKGFDQCYNGQSAVNEDMIIVDAYSNAHGNVEQEFIPKTNTIPNERGEISSAVADTRYFSEKNINDCQSEEIEPIISTARKKHNTYLGSLLNKEDCVNQGNTPVNKMNKILSSKKGKEIYKRRKQTVESVFRSGDL